MAAFSIIAAVGLSLFLPLVSPISLGFIFVLALLAIGVFLLIIPAWQLMQSQDSKDAAKLFDRASFYPLALLVLITVKILFF